MSDDYEPWSPWYRRWVHARWWLADLLFALAYKIQGDA